MISARFCPDGRDESKLFTLTMAELKFKVLVYPSEVFFKIINVNNVR